MSEAEHTREARRWLQYGGEDLRAAELMLDKTGFVPRQACWLAQQSAEKSLKAALVYLQIDFPRSHDLDLLRNRIPGTWQVRTQHPDLAALTQWAVEARYPGDWAEATEIDARLATQQARGVYESIATDLSRLGFPVPGH
jgi:HEPN domain-containing protein